MDGGRGASRASGQDLARLPSPAGSRAAAAGPGEAGDAAAAPTRQEEEEGEEEDVRPRTGADAGRGTGKGWPQTPTLLGRGPRGMGVPSGLANSSPGTERGPCRLPEATQERSPAQFQWLQAALALHQFLPSLCRAPKRAGREGNLVGVRRDRAAGRRAGDGDSGCERSPGGGLGDQGATCYRMGYIGVGWGWGGTGDTWLCNSYSAAPSSVTATLRTCHRAGTAPRRQGHRCARTAPAGRVPRAVQGQQPPGGSPECRDSTHRGDKPLSPVPQAARGQALRLTARR